MFININASHHADHETKHTSEDRSDRRQLQCHVKASHKIRPVFLSQKRYPSKKVVGKFIFSFLPYVSNYVNNSTKLFTFQYFIAANCLFLLFCVKFCDFIYFASDLISLLFFFFCTLHRKAFYFPTFPNWLYWQINACFQRFSAFFALLSNFSAEFLLHLHDSLYQSPQKPFIFLQNIPVFSCIHSPEMLYWQKWYTYIWR